MEILFYLALLTFVVICLVGIELYVGIRKIKFLRDIAPTHNSEMPKVSVIIPARNEEKDIKIAVSSILSQDYQNLEVIVVNDRSTDGTSAILKELTLSHQRLRVFYLSELPSGWLGKTHAIHHGVERASGEYYLLADADVVMEPTTVSRAISYMLGNQLDHLILGPEIKAKDVLSNMLGLVLAKTFLLLLKPWKAKDRKSKSFIGGGAFSLLKSEVYQAIGTIKAVALCVVDDLMLGQRIKQHGFRQEFLSGDGLISIEWYASLRDMIHGLTKNFFAGFGYKPMGVLGFTGLSLLLYLWPLAGSFLTSNSTQLLNIAIVALTMLIYLGLASYFRKSIWYAWGYPIGMELLLFIIWRSTIVTLLNKGINWRNTHYSLDMLKQGRS